ncbi:hypothetical protein KUTeg_023538 [Tegillarca granosa]|uniref:Transposable element P transposase-like RNase H domain-containing protein n=1 Tax=Tegillarca granosa TaxID=220873 RepID=A0ABQ9E209_TEGGR|nr:hypothetical protein KUTeg_023538 [Tegillarca granosa]
MSSDNGHIHICETFCNFEGFRSIRATILCCLVASTLSATTIGHFTDYLINANRVINEITFFRDGKWSLNIMGKSGAEDISYEDTELFFKEQVSKCDSNTYITRRRSVTRVTPESIIMDQLKDKKQQRVLATHVLQFVFLGFTGFRFPFAHFPSTTASATDLYLLMWKSVNMLSMFGFKIQYISTDGAQTNRDLFKLLIPNFNSGCPSTCSFYNIYCKDNPKIFFIMDISHVVKKIRKKHFKEWKWISKRQDIISSISGFEELCHYKLKLSHSSIIPSRVKSDVQRTLHNGANTNLVTGDCRSLNSVILGETSASRKSNTGGEGASIYKVES